MSKKALSAPRIALIGFVFAVLVNGGVFTWLASSSRSWGPRPQLAVWFLPLVGVGLIVGLIGLGLLIPRSSRHKGLALIAASVLTVVPFPFAMRAGQEARMGGLDDFVERSKPLVAAIRAYEEQRGDPPEDLTELVPEFLSSIPETGIGPSPQYEFVSGTKARERFGERWVLRVPCSSGFLNWDELLYYESQDYPAAFGNSAWLERRGDWAYAHE